MSRARGGRPAWIGLRPARSGRAGPAPAGLYPGIAFTRPPKPEMGDLALPAFPVAKRLGQPPPAVAARWAEAVRAELERPDGRVSRSLEVPVTRVQPAGPYVNLALDPAALARLVTAAVAERGDALRARARTRPDRR